MTFYLAIIALLISHTQASLPDMRVSDLYFSHDSISKTFGSKHRPDDPFFGVSILYTLEELVLERIYPNDITSFPVVWNKATGRWHVTTGNRRLWIFKSLAWIRQEDFHVSVIQGNHHNFFEKNNGRRPQFTTNNGGSSVTIRKQDNGFNWKYQQIVCDAYHRVAARVKAPETTFWTTSFGQPQDSEASVRVAALCRIGKMDRETLKKNEDAILGHLQDPEAAVRVKALHTIGKMGLETLKKNEDALFGQLQDSEAAVAVRIAALHAIGKMGLETLKKKEDALFGQLQDSEAMVRVAALEVIGKMDRETLKKKEDALFGQLQDSEAVVRVAALGAIGNMDHKTLKENEDALFGLIQDVRQHIGEECMKSTSAVHQRNVLAQCEHKILKNVRDNGRAVHA